MTEAGRRQELLQAIDGHGPATLSLVPQRLCDVAVERLGVEASGIALISSPAARHLLAASGRLAGIVEDLQFSLGEGPCLDAFSTGVAALEPDLARGGRARWPLFADAALAAGIASVFAFPLQVGLARFGVLDLTRDRTGMLDGEGIADAWALAGLATETVLRLQSTSVDGEIADDLGGIGSERIVVHQATGMVSVQAGVPVADALARLRARAFAESVALHHLAADVVAGHVRFEPA